MSKHILEREWSTPRSQRIEYGSGTQLLRHGGNSIDVWNAATGEMLWQHTPSQPSTHGIRGIRTPDHEQVITYCDQDRLELRSARDGSLIRILGGRIVAGNWHMAVHPDGKSAFTCDYSGTIESVSLVDGKRLFQVSTKPGDKMTQLTVARDSATEDGLLIAAFRAPYGRQLICVCNAHTGAKLEAPRGGREDIASMDVHPLSDKLLIQ